MKHQAKKKGIIWPILFVAILLVAIVTCPKRDAHKEAVMKEFNTLINQKSNDLFEDEEQALGLLSTSLASGFVEWMLDANFEVDNYFVCSLGRFSNNKEKEWVSIGLFGHIFLTFDEDDLENAINN